MSHGNIDVPERIQRDACPVTEVLQHVGNKWSIGIIVAASEGAIRFTELERAIPGISRRMLTLNLRRLERDGLLSRKVYPTIPPKVEYSLTPMARELTDTLPALVSWAERNRDSIARARMLYDQQSRGRSQEGE